MEDKYLIKDKEPPWTVQPGEENGERVVKNKPVKGFGNRFRSLLFRFLVVVYIFGVLTTGYWYWMRPVRDSHVHNAYEWWTEIAEDYGLPIPSSERWQ